MAFFKTASETMDCSGEPAESLHQTKMVTKDSSDKSFKCDYCKKIFSSSTTLAKHHRMHNISTSLRVKCFQKALYSKGFSKNLKMHSLFECTHCKKLFAHKSNLTRHLRIHSGEKPFECNLCGKSFTSSSNLVQHVSTHAVQNPFKCGYCKKVFTKSNELTKHIQSHIETKSSDHISINSSSPQSDMLSNYSSPMDVAWSLQQQQPHLISSHSTIPNSVTTQGETEGKPDHTYCSGSSHHQQQNLLSKERNTFLLKNSDLKTKNKSYLMESTNQPLSPDHTYWSTSEHIQDNGKKKIKLAKEPKSSHSILANISAKHCAKTKLDSGFDHTYCTGGSNHKKCQKTVPENHNPGLESIGTRNRKEAYLGLKTCGLPYRKPDDHTYSSGSNKSKVVTRRAKSRIRLISSLKAKQSTHASRVNHAGSVNDVEAAPAPCRVDDAAPAPSRVDDIDAAPAPSRVDHVDAAPAPCRVDNEDPAPTPCRVDDEDPAPGGMDPVDPAPCGMDPVDPAPCGMDPVDPAPCGMDPVDPDPCGMDSVDPAPCGVDPVDPAPCGVDPVDPAPCGVDPVDAVPAPCGVDPVDAVPAPCGVDPVDAVPAPCSVDPVDAVPSPCGVDPVDAVPAPCGVDPVDAVPAPCSVDPVDAVPSPCGVDPVDAVPAPCGVDPVDAVPAPCSVDPVDAVPSPCGVDPVDAVPAPCSVDPVDAAPAPSRVDPVDAAPAPSRVDPVAAAPAPSRVGPIDAAPVPYSVDIIDDAPAPSSVDPVDVVPAPKRMNPVDAVPAPSRVDPVDAAPTASRVDPVDPDHTYSVDLDLQVISVDRVAGTELPCASFELVDTKLHSQPDHTYCHKKSKISTPKANKNGCKWVHKKGGSACLNDCYAELRGSLSVTVSPNQDFLDHTYCFGEQLVHNITSDYDNDHTYCSGNGHLQNITCSDDWSSGMKFDHTYCLARTVSRHF